jgi:hypothetical protein
VTLAALAIIAADTIGRDRIRSKAVGRLLDERRPRRRRSIWSLACVSRAMKDTLTEVCCKSDPPARARSLRGINIQTNARISALKVPDRTAQGRGCPPF